MNRLTLPAASKDVRAFAACSPCVYVDDRRRRDLRIVKWELETAPHWGLVETEIFDPRFAGASLDIAEGHRLPPIGARLNIRMAPHADDEFCGVVTAHHIETGSEGPKLRATAQHHLAILLQEPIAGRWEMSPNGVVHVDVAAVQFNSGADGRASAALHQVNGRACRVFDCGADSRLWSVGDAMAYLAATAAPDMTMPTAQRIASMGGEIVMKVVDVTGRPLAEVLTALARNTGLELRPSQTGKRLDVYRPGRQGRLRSVRIQPVGESLNSAATNLHSSRIKVRLRPAQRGILVLGAAKRWEITRELKPGWDTQQQSDRWRDFVRSESDRWPERANVFRKWVLNEHGWYDDVPVGDLSGIGEDDFRTRAPRQLQPCISTDRQGQSLGIVVEVDVGSGWRRWRGPLWTSRDECAVYLGGDSLPGEFFRAAVAGSARVRVTGCLDADRRLTVERQGDPGMHRRVIDAASRAKWRAVHPSSIFFGDDCGPPGKRDDTVLLNRIADSFAQADAKALGAELSLMQIDSSFRVGDRIRCIEGRHLDLCTRDGAAAWVTRVRHDFGRQQTLLTMSGS
jgi:hypothetical protein